eukprot:14471-Rhodomonas_salina.3
MQTESGVWHGGAQDSIGQFSIAIRNDLRVVKCIGMRSAGLCARSMFGTDTQWIAIRGSRLSARPWWVQVNGSARWCSDVCCVWGVAELS